MVKKRVQFQLLISLALGLMFASSVMAAPTPANFSKPNSLLFSLKKEIGKFYGGAKVELLSEVRWSGSPPSEEITPQSVLSVSSDDGRGNVQFSVAGHIGSVRVSAWVSGKVAIRRIRPGELLDSQSFATQQIDVASGIGHEYRGVILPSETELSGLEATQSLLEGQFLVSSSAKRVPDIRRGDSISIHLLSGELEVSTLGIAQEPAYINSQVRVLTHKGKREFSGMLRAGGVVEVKL